MNSISIYYLKANLIIAIITLLYFVFYKKETHFQLNRLFLLLGITSALIIPVIRISIQDVQTLHLPINEFTFNNLGEIYMGENEFSKQQPASFELSWVFVLQCFYSVGVLFFLVRFLLFIRKLFTLLKRGALRREGNIYFVATNQQVQAFSFFNLFFYNEQIEEDKDFDTIVNHEKVHVKQLHSVDLLLTEILLVLFWFNPFVFLLKKAVRANHEYLADSTVLNHGKDKLEYMLTLKSQATSGQFGGFGSHFKSSTLKNRIIMITKQKSTILKSWKYILIIPFLAALLLSFCNKELAVHHLGNNTMPEHLKVGKIIELPDGNQLTFIGSSMINRISDNTILITNVKEMTSENLRFFGDKFEYNSDLRTVKALGDSCFMEKRNKNEPEFSFNMSDISLDVRQFIYPIEDKLIKTTSGFGMRKHPISKKLKMHNGIDFAAPKGTPVKAIAKGVVREIKNNPGTYGKYVIVDHPNGFSSLSAQLSGYKVKAGDKVMQGDVIGYVGSSGLSTGPHLHLELKKDGEFVDPANYIQKRK